MKKTLFTLLMGSALLLNSCVKGDKGDTGPAGANGNANVYGTNSVTVTSWTATTGMYSAQIAVPDITSSVVGTGSVQVYLQYPSEWDGLPDISNGNITAFGFYIGVVNIYVTAVNGGVPTYPGSLTFRVVVIPSSVRMAHPNANWKNYEETKAIMNLKD
jgi:hypothetical protein